MDRRLGSAADPGRSARPSSRRRELVQTAILEQAARLFAERGYSDTTPQDIADAVGMSRQALYYYVSSKEQILAELVSETTTQMNTEIRQIVERGLDPRETLHRLAYRLASDRARNGLRFRLLDRSEAALPADLAQAFLEGRRESLALIVSVLECGVAQGWFHSPDIRVSGLSVFGMCNWVAWWFEPGPEHPVEPIATQIADSVVSMLANAHLSGAETPPTDARGVIDAIEQQLARLRLLTTGKP